MSKEKIGMNDIDLENQKLINLSKWQVDLKSIISWKELEFNLLG